LVEDSYQALTFGGVFGISGPVNSPTSDGLAHDRVNRIVRDSRGFLWFCTGEGLSRFDGYQFKNYTRDDGLPHRSVYDLLETHDGNYLVATGGGLVQFNPHGMARRWRGFESNPPANDEALMFRVFRPEDESGDTSSWSVSKLQLDASGTVWAATGFGLYRADRIGRDWKLRRVDKDAWRDKAKDFDTLLLDRDGALWVAGIGGLYRVLPDGRVHAEFKELSIVSLLQDKAGYVWAGTRGEGPGGLYQFTYSGLSAPKLVQHFTEKDGLSGRYWNNAILETTDGTLWLGGTGLCQRSKQSDTHAPAFRKISDQGANSLQEDIGGNLWIGTESSGAVRLSRNGFRSFEESDGLKSNRITSIVNGLAGEVFILSGEKAIHRFDDGRFTAVSPQGMLKTSWGWNQISFQDHAGEWWIAGQDGLQRYPKVNRMEDLANTKPKRLYTVKDGLDINFIFRLFEDSRGDIWIGTLGPVSVNLARWERANDRIHNYRGREDLLDRIGPTAFSEDRFGNIWIGYYNGGLVRYRNGLFQSFNEKEGLPAGFIRDAYTDSAGRVWIASTAGGVARIDEPNAEHPKLVNISTAEGLSSNQATCIAEDNFGRIYIGTGRGVNRVNTQTGRIKLFTSADGLAENLVHVCARDKSGALWFGFYNGLSRYVPEPDIQTAPPPIFISDVVVNGTSFKKLSELGNAAVENLELAPEQRQIQINFFALGFSTGETLRYQYKLDNTDWSEPTAQRTVNLNLSPGAYRFLVRAVNAEGVISPNPAVVTLALARPVWQRWWFLSLAVLLVCGLVYATYRYRLAQLLKVERVRTRIATDLHDDIGASLSRMAILSEVVKQKTAGNGNQASGLLTEIADSARGLVDSMSDIVWSIDPRRDDLQSVVRRIRQFASDVLEAKGIDWELRVPPEVESLKLDPEERQHLFLIFKEGINNVARHGEGTKSVSLSIKVEGRQLIGEIKDNGCGFTPKQPDEARSKGRGGNGLPNMRGRAEQLGGRLEIASSPGAGTRLTLKMPIK
jgi:signal transduction histidine kinase/ligand-binding sensor domain-containing protein